MNHSGAEIPRQWGDIPDYHKEFNHPNVDFDAPDPTKIAHDPLSPEDWSSFHGQSKMKADLEVRIGSALVRGESLDHVLLVASPGMGKTTLAKVIASKMGVDLFVCPTPIKERELIALIKRMQDGDILFLDECHQIGQGRGQAENILPILATGTTRHGVELPKITIVAATTEPDRLSQPFIDRFPIQPYFEDYTISDMRAILRGMLSRLGVPVADVDIHNLARAANSVPRLAGGLARGARDLHAVTSELPRADDVLEFCGIRKDGLDRGHERYVATLLWLYGKDTSTGTVYKTGLANLCRALDMKRESVERIERQLIKRGLISLTGSGRELTDAGVEMGKKVVHKYYDRAIV